MVGDPEQQRKRRRDEANKLAEAFKDERREFTKETFSALETILHHEYLCLVMSSGRHSIGTEFLDCLSAEVSEHAIPHSWVESVLLQISKCLIHSEGREPFLERQAQARLLLTLLSLVLAHDVTTLEANYHHGLFRNLAMLFRDLSWECTLGSPYALIHRRASCSFLLSACKEYASSLRPNQPISIDVATRGMHAVSAVVMAASPAIVGNVATGYQCLLANRGRAVASI